MYFLRELQRSDISEINKWRNNPELISYLGAPFRYINHDVDDDWYSAYLASRSNTVRCSICDDNEDRVYGLVSLTGIDFINRTATLHIMIGEEENCGKGIGTFAVTKMLFHAFNNMNLNRIELCVLTTNERALKLYKKVGFIEEGIKRKSVYKNGEYTDMIQMSILRSEFEKKNFTKKEFDYTDIKVGGGYEFILYFSCSNLRASAIRNGVSPKCIFSIAFRTYKTVPRLYYKII